MSIKMNGPELLHILIVDDNQNLTLALSIGLKRAGFSVEVANNGKQALGQLTNHKFDAVLTDVQMPYLTGVELAEEISRKSPGTQIIVMSAFEKPSKLEQISFLSKPFEFESLLHLLSPPLNGFESSSLGAS